jgi:hypothetical protein
METRDSIIDDLRRMGVRINAMLFYNPTTQQLKDLRDGLKWFEKKNNTNPNNLNA